MVLCLLEQYKEALKLCITLKCEHWHWFNTKRCRQTKQLALFLVIDLQLDGTKADLLHYMLTTCPDLLSSYEECHNLCTCEPNHQVSCMAKKHAKTIRQLTSLGNHQSSILCCCSCEACNHL